MMLISKKNILCILPKYTVKITEIFPDIEQVLKNIQCNLFVSLDYGKSFPNSQKFVGEEPKRKLANYYSSETNR